MVKTHRANAGFSLVGRKARGWWIGFCSLIPVIYMAYQVVKLQSGDWEVLGPEPGRAVVFFMGEWALYFLVLTLLVTPLRNYLGWTWLIHHRRMLGLYCFFYASLHLLAYCTFLLEWDFGSIIEDLVKRPYLTFGMVGWLILIPLAVTSMNYWMRRLGRRWKQLHTGVYVVAILVAVHYLLQIRSNWFEPVLWSSVLAVLLIERLIRRNRLFR